MHFVAFDKHNKRDRLDDSRTKGNAACLFVTVGSKLVSKSNNDLMQIVADNSPPWSHDFLTGMKAEIPESVSSQATDWAKLAAALRTFGILPHQIPTTLNFFSRVTVDSESGLLTRRSGSLDYLGEVELRADADCIVAFSVCSEAGGRTEPAEISIFRKESLTEEVSAQ